MGRASLAFLAFLAPTFTENCCYDPVPFDWHDEWPLESQGTQERRRILEELRDWAAEDVPGWRRRYEAPRLFAMVADEFDDEVLAVIELGLKAPAAIGEQGSQPASGGSARFCLVARSVARSDS